MPRKRRKRKTPKRVLRLPDLQFAKTAVLNTLTSESAQRSYDHAITEFVDWYCSEPRPEFLSFNKHKSPTPVNLTMPSPLLVARV